MRQVVLDTETTGLELADGHCIIEIGCIELLHRRPSGRSWHRYFKPGREVEAGALAVHGITNEFLASQAPFAEAAAEFLAFIEGAELVIHNAPFDTSFLDAELKRAGLDRTVSATSPVLDTLELARRLHPGQRNSLDALCKRYAIDNSGRELHGALLDARILTDVYLAMTGGQAALGLDGGPAAAADGTAPVRRPRGAVQIPVIDASAQELAAHERMLASIERASGKDALFRALERQAGKH